MSLYVWFMSLCLGTKKRLVRVGKDNVLVDYVDTNTTGNSPEVSFKSPVV